MKNIADVSKSTSTQLNRIRTYLKKLIVLNGSDLHVKANSAIRARINGDIVQFAGDIFSQEDATIFAKELLKGMFDELVEKRELDLIYSFDDRNRFRVNIFFQMDGISAVFRVIPLIIPTISGLKLPEIVREFAKKEKGLVIVTGITGSGKSTTLAALVHEINITQKKHIITIEDPIEFIHRDKGCIINQRSVGQDTHSFENALRAALREDPDIILIGEMRDRVTMNLALQAADTGHLVFSTLHTVDAKDTINRIISSYATDEQNRVRLSLSGVLKGIISQRLIQKIDGGRIAAVEVLIHTPTIEKLIMEGRDYEIKDAIAKGRDHYKSQSFDQHILELYNEGIISKERAVNAATSPADLELIMSGLSHSTTRNPNFVEPGEATIQEDIFDLK